MKDEMDRLVRSFEGIPIVEKGDYHYFVHPLSDGIPIIAPEQLQDATTCIMELLPPPENYDLLITAEAMGIPLTTLLSQRVSKPFSIARKRRYGIKGEITVKQSTGYSSSDIHLNLPNGNGHLVIVDDVLSTGGTLASIMNGIRGTGWNVASAVILFNKMGGRKSGLEKVLGFPIITLLDVELIGDSYRARKSE